MMLHFYVICFLLHLSAPDCEKWMKVTGLPNCVPQLLALYYVELSFRFFFWRKKPRLGRANGYFQDENVE